VHPAPPPPARAPALRAAEDPGELRDGRQTLALALAQGRGELDEQRDLQPPRQPRELRCHRPRLGAAEGDCPKLAQHARAAAGVASQPVARVGEVRKDATDGAAGDRALGDGRDVEDGRAHRLTSRARSRRCRSTGR
jgi:hypothetical protein